MSKKDAAYRKITFNPPDGPWQTADYFITGQKQFVGKLAQLSPDVPTGRCTYFHSNGKVSAEVELSPESEVLSEKIYAEDGTLISEGRACKTQYGPGVEVIEYYQNGKIKSKGKRFEKTKVGVWTYYDTNGKATQVQER